LDHIIVVDERHLRRVLREYLAYYHEARCHLALGKDAPIAPYARHVVPDMTRFMTHLRSFW
jgi:hypothetical protein